MRRLFRGLCRNALSNGTQELGIFWRDALRLPCKVFDVLFEEESVPCAADEIFAAGIGVDAVEREFPFLRLGVFFPVVAFN